jgi:Ca2+-binding EF-hand superfamily protein
MIPSGGGIGGPGGLNHLRQELFGKLDANQSGGIEETEFVEGLTGQNSELSAEAAKKVFAAFDSDSDGVLSEQEFKTGFQRLSSAVKGTLIGLQEAPPPPPSPDEMFARTDGDSSGDLSIDEFVAGAPDGPRKPSEDQLKELFAALDADDSGSLSEDEFRAGMKHRGPPPGDAAGAPPPPPQEGDGEDSNPLLALLKDSTSNGISQQDLNTLFATFFKLQAAGTTSVSTTA